MTKLAIALIALAGLLLGARAMLHAASASHTLDNGVVVQMDLWYKEAAKGSGAYLYVNRSGRWSEIEIYTWDWAHWVRTSLYQTSQGKIAVVHPFGGPPTHIVPLDGKPIERWDHRKKDSDIWTYLGAFDWRDRYSPGSSQRQFDFILPSEQAECVPMGGGGMGQSYQPRAEHQRDICPSP